MDELLLAGDRRQNSLDKMKASIASVPGRKLVIFPYLPSEYFHVAGCISPPSSSSSIILDLGTVGSLDHCLSDDSGQISRQSMILASLLV